MPSPQPCESSGPFFAVYWCLRGRVIDGLGFCVRAWSRKLATYLPMPVEADKGDAKFDGKKELLIVTLPIKIDDDF